MLHHPFETPHAFTRVSKVRVAALAMAVLSAASCGGRQQVVVIEAPVDADQIALRATEATALPHPSQIVFEWSLAEQGVRADGQGVARVEPAYKARLDLFLSNAETATRAAMVRDELRMPPGMPDDILPPSHLLWGTLGVFRPGLGTSLLGGDRLEEGAMRLRYRIPGGSEVHYRLDASLRVREVEVVQSGSVVQRLTLEHDEGRFPAEIVYRDLAQFRQLTIRRSSEERVEPFPPDIWRP